MDSESGETGEKEGMEWGERVKKVGSNCVGREWEGGMGLIKSMPRLGNWYM